MRGLGLYTLVNRKPRRCRNAMEWAEWFGRNDDDRIVDRTKVGRRTVSTVFLGVDHNFSREGPPLLFETMVFPQGDPCVRTATWDAAQKTHNEIVRQIRSGDVN